MHAALRSTIHGLVLQKESVLTNFSTAVKVACELGSSHLVTSFLS